MWFEAPRVVTGAMTGPLTDFTIDLRLKSAGHLGDYTVGENTPPMPLAFSGFGLYRLGHNYLLSDSASGLSVEFGQPTEFHRITIIQSGRGRSDKDEAKLVVRLDGDVVASQATLSDIEGGFSLGRGFQQRYWRGEMEYVDFVPRAVLAAPTATSRRIAGASDLLATGKRSGFPW